MGPEERDRTHAASEAAEPVPVWTRIERFHRMLVGLLRELEETTDPVRIRELVGTLDRDMPGHFADEVAPGGLFEALATRRPASESILKCLRQDHREILGMLRSLHRRLEEMDPDDAGILEDKRAFVLRIRSHEQRENRLVTDTYLLDEGGLG